MNTKSSSTNAQSLTVLSRLWRDENAAVLSIELVLLATVVAIGVIVGLAAFRDSLVTELADSGGAIGELDQSYMYTGLPATMFTFGTAPNQVTVTVSVAGSTFVDNADRCEPGTTEASENNQPANENSLCVVTVAAIQENDANNQPSIAP